MPKDKGSKLADFLGLAIARLKGERPHLNPKGQTGQSTTGHARAAKEALRKQLSAKRYVAKAEAARQKPKPKPEPVADHRIDVYRNLVSMLVEVKTTQPSSSKKYKIDKKNVARVYKDTEALSPEQVAAKAKAARELAASNIRGRRIYGDQDESGSA
jgi:hypothetical protein